MLCLVLSCNVFNMVLVCGRMFDRVKESIDTKIPFYRYSSITSSSTKPSSAEPSPSRVSASTSTTRPFHHEGEYPHLGRSAPVANGAHINNINHTHNIRNNAATGPAGPAHRAPSPLSRRIELSRATKRPSNPVPYVADLERRGGSVGAGTERGVAVGSPTLPSTLSLAHFPSSRSTPPAHGPGAYSRWPVVCKTTGDVDEMAIRHSENDRTNYWSSGATASKSCGGGVPAVSRRSPPGRHAGSFAPDRSDGAEAITAGVVRPKVAPAPGGVCHQGYVGGVGNGGRGSWIPVSGSNAYADSAAVVSPKQQPAPPYAVSRFGALQKEQQQLQHQAPWSTRKARSPSGNAAAAEEAATAVSGASSSRDSAIGRPHWGDIGNSTWRS